MSEPASSRSPQPVGLLAFRGEEGDHVSRGESHRFTPANAEFRITRNAADRLEIQLEGQGPLNWWRIELVAPNGRFRPGRYRQAARTAFAEPGQPGFTLAGPGRGHNTSVSTFTVRAVRFNRERTAITYLSATFTQRGEPSTAPPVRGQLVWGHPPRRPRA